MPCGLARDDGRGTVRLMCELLVLAVHMLVTFAKLLRPDGVRVVAGDSMPFGHRSFEFFSFRFENFLQCLHTQP